MSWSDLFKSVSGSSPGSNRREGVALYSVDPPTASEGQPVVVRGVGFQRGPELSVRFGTTIVSATFIHTQKLQCTVPFLAKEGLTEIAVSFDGTSWNSNSAIFTYGKFDPTKNSPVVLVSERGIAPIRFDEPASSPPSSSLSPIISATRTPSPAPVHAPSSSPSPVISATRTPSPAASPSLPARSTFKIPQQATTSWDIDVIASPPPRSSLPVESLPPPQLNFSLPPSSLTTSKLWNRTSAPLSDSVIGLRGTSSINIGLEARLELRHKHCRPDDDEFRELIERCGNPNVFFDTFFLYIPSMVMMDPADVARVLAPEESPQIKLCRPELSTQLVEKLRENFDTSRLPVRLILTDLRFENKYHQNGHGGLLIPYKTWFDEISSMHNTELVHAAIQIGPYIIEWDEGGLVIPRASIYAESLLNMEYFSLTSLDINNDKDKTVLEKLCAICADWNNGPGYHQVKRNAQHFVQELLGAVEWAGLEKDNTLGVLLEKLRQAKHTRLFFVDALTPNNVIYFNHHADLDNFCFQRAKDLAELGMPKETQLGTLKDFEVLKQIDRALWLRLVCNLSSTSSTTSTTPSSTTPSSTTTSSSSSSMATTKCYFGNPFDEDACNLLSSSTF